MSRLYVPRSRRPARALTLLLAAALLIAAAALAAVPASGAPSRAHAARGLLTSKELWATIDVCSPSDQPDTVGVRGSMPGEARVNERMYMSFRLQYLNRSTNQWSELPLGSAPYVSVGSAASVRQGGRSFQLVPAAGKPAVQLRGLVAFQWRRGTHVIASTTRLTTAGHRSVAGADPAGYSAATCQVG